MENPDFLKEKYNNLHTSNEVVAAARNNEFDIEESISQKPTDRIQNYLKRLERLVLDPENLQDTEDLGDLNNTERPRALSLLREMVLNKYVRPNKNKLAEGAAMVEERAARDMGIDMHYGQEQLAERGDIAVKDLESSLDQWITYLSDKNEPYPTWFRYYAFRNILDLGEFNKDKQEFPNRTPGTNRLFPDIDRGALARMEDIINCAKDPQALTRFQEAQRKNQTPENQLMTVAKAKAFSQLSFAKQYAESMKDAGEITSEMRAETRGEWKLYKQNSDPTELWSSLQNKGTAWCTKGFATAETQLKGGDFYVYYTLDKQGAPTIPRIAIRMQNGSIFETRGVADTKQNLEGNMQDIADVKMSTLPGKEKYEQISAQMKQMTELDTKSFKKDKKTDTETYLNPTLNKEELTFLYEVNTPIQSFGYAKDPRIEKLRSKRNLKEDLPILFDCKPEQIATSPEDLNKNTLAYIGPRNPAVIQKMPKTVTHIYESFPDKKVFLKEIIPDPEITSAGTAITKLEKEGHQISDYSKDMLTKVNWSEKLKSSYEIVSFSVSDLFGDKNDHTFGDIKIKAQELGLDLIPPSLAPSIRLNYPKNGEWTAMALKESIRDRGGSLGLFGCDRGGAKSWLYNNRGHDGYMWLDNLRFFFVRK